MVFPEVTTADLRNSCFFPPCLLPSTPAPGLTVFLIEQILDLLPQRVGNVDPGEPGIIIFCKVKNNYGLGLLKGT